MKSEKHLTYRQALLSPPLQSMSQEIAPANAIPEPSPPGTVTSHPFRKHGWSKGWYADGFHTHLNVKEEVLSHIQDRDADLKKKGAKFSTFTTEGDYGRIRVHAQQFPGLDNPNADSTRVRILVERMSDDERQMKEIDLQDLPAYETDG